MRLLELLPKELPREFQTQKFSPHSVPRGTAPSLSAQSLLFVAFVTSCPLEGALYHPL